MNLAGSVIEMNILRFSPCKCIRNQIWPCHKVGQGQPRFIICANLVGPTSPILHTKFQSQLSIKFAFNWPRIVWENYVLICWLDSNISDLGWKVKDQPWPLNLFIDTKLNISSENNDFGFHSIQKINFSKNFPFKCIRKQTWPWL